jgi:hypothetical protein
MKVRDSFFPVIFSAIIPKQKVISVECMSEIGGSNKYIEYGLCSDSRENPKPNMLNAECLWANEEVNGSGGF